MLTASLAFALARRRGSVLIASIQEHESGDTQPDTHARAFFDRMVDAAIYASASHASEVREKRPKLSVARSYVLRYGHFAGASVPDVSQSFIRSPGTDRGPDVVALAGPLGDNEVGVIETLKQVCEYLELQIVLATDDISESVARRVDQPHRSAPLDEFSQRRIMSSANFVLVPWTGGANVQAVLLSLSVGTPVLARASAELAALQRRVGRAWLRLYDDDLTSLGVIQSLSARRESTSPDLEMFSATGAADLIRSIYEGAISSPALADDPLAASKESSLT